MKDQARVFSIVDLREFSTYLSSKTIELVGFLLHLVLFIFFVRHGQ
jgi:hypothetical protein